MPWKSLKPGWMGFGGGRSVPTYGRRVWSKIFNVPSNPLAFYDPVITTFHSRVPNLTLPPSTSITSKYQIPNHSQQTEMRLPHCSHTTGNPAAPKTCCDTNPHSWLTHHREREAEPQEGFRLSQRSSSVNPAAPSAHTAQQSSLSAWPAPPSSSSSSRDSSPKQCPTASPARCVCTPCCLQMCPAAGGWGGTAETSRLREEQPECPNHPSRPSRAQLQSHVAQNINIPWKRHTARVKCTGRANTQLHSGPLTVFFYGYKERL